MIKGKTVLAVIPARGGSKAVPRKNIRPLAGVPLIGWTIRAAQQARTVDRVIVSSEDDEIVRIARSLGCETPFVRPVELARDETSSLDVVLHAMDHLPEYDYVVLLQPTCPFRTNEDIDGCVRTCVERGAPSCVSVTDIDTSPNCLYLVQEAGLLVPLLGWSAADKRRQAFPSCVRLNGAVYVTQTDWLRRNRTFVNARTVPYRMPQDRSLDIDTAFQFRLAELLMRSLIAGS
jgi:CMP-N,N'-diacetyllegionaminic acid synthase